jgi:hypothetical protein
VSLDAVPQGDDMYLCAIWAPGRQLRAVSGASVAWVTDWAFPGHYWADLTERSVKSGVQPFLLSRRDRGPRGPGYIGEIVSDGTIAPLVTSGRQL